MIARRTAFLAAAGVLLAPALVVAGPARPAAALHDGGSGLTDYSQPVGVPSSVLGGRGPDLYPELVTPVAGTLDGATPAERARLVGNTIPRDAGLNPDGTRRTATGVPVSGPRTLTKDVGGAFARGIGVLSVVGGAFDVTNTAMRYFGVPEDQIGMDALFQTLFPPEIVAGYVPNVDTEGLGGGASGTFAGPLGAPTYYEGLGTDDASPTLLQGLVRTDQNLGEWLYFRFNCGNGSSVVMTGHPASLNTGPGAETNGWAGFGFNEAAAGNPSGNAGLRGNPCNAATPGQPPVRVLMQWVDVPTATDYDALVDLAEVVSLNDPERMWKVRTRCNVDGSPVWNDEYSVPFKESDVELPAFPEAQCETGLLEAAELWQVTPAAPDLDVLLDTWELGPQGDVVRDWMNGTRGELELHRIGTDGSPDLSCLDNPELCLDWWVDPDRATKYRCTYAGAPVDVRECAVYAPTPNALAGRDLTTEEGTKVPAGTYYPHGDPATGLHTPGDPEPGGEPGAEPAPAPQSDDCPPPFTGLSLFNPWWYYQATVCALQFAFVPPPAELQAEVQKTQDVINAKGPGQWVDAIGVQVDAIGTWDDTTGDCLGPNIAWSTWGHDFDMYVFEACDPPRSTVAGHVQFWISVIVWFGALLGTAWIVASALNIHMPWDGSEADG